MPRSARITVSDGSDNPNKKTADITLPENSTAIRVWFRVTADCETHSARPSAIPKKLKLSLCKNILQVPKYNIIIIYIIRVNQFTLDPETRF